MKTYEFDILLKDVEVVTDEQADALFAAGCEDGTPVTWDGTSWVHFDREAASLEDAIRTAVEQVRAASCDVSRIELDAGSAIFQPA